MICSYALELIVSGCEWYSSRYTVLTSLPKVRFLLFFQDFACCDCQMREEITLEIQHLHLLGEPQHVQVAQAVNLLVCPPDPLEVVPVHAGDRIGFTPIVHLLPPVGVGS